jgi:hypothetical protein
LQQYNGPRSIMTAYQTTLDGFMQQAVADSNRLNQIQLVILAIEGALVGLMAVCVLWYMASQVSTSCMHATLALGVHAHQLALPAAAQVAFRRFSIYTVFLMAPQVSCWLLPPVHDCSPACACFSAASQGVVRSIATRAIYLEETDGVEEVSRQGRQVLLPAVSKAAPRLGSAWLMILLCWAQEEEDKVDLDDPAALAQQLVRAIMHAPFDCRLCHLVSLPPSQRHYSAA